MKVNQSIRDEITGLCDKFHGLDHDDVDRIVGYCEASKHDHLNLEAVALEFAQDNDDADESGETRLTELGALDSADGNPHTF